MILNHGRLIGGHMHEAVHSGAPRASIFKRLPNRLTLEDLDHEKPTDLECAD
jgi:hypothetical protein